MNKKKEIETKNYDIDLPNYQNVILLGGGIGAVGALVFGKNIFLGALLGIALGFIIDKTYKNKEDNN